jgi:hypothetical protein
MKYFLVFIPLVLTSGCAGFGQVERIDDLSVTQLQQLQEIKLYDSPEALNYVSLGKIKGISCKGSAFSGNTEKEAAITQLKIKALKVDSNAILYTTCSHDSSVDWGNNCWDSWVCVGEAIRLK